VIFPLDIDADAEIPLVISIEPPSSDIPEPPVMETKPPDPKLLPADRIIEDPK